ncbi:hypothetical protein INT45_012196 [Circinella minor]|uniref:F-box domain-containing protein n=1 Tax=Circinella minor TaxID=1195481 RepID=A0A8H7RV98_9FUNG|nr:hypothetical protein INT45_012196 [Circinella minor]
MSTALPVTKATTIINTAIPLSFFEKVKNSDDPRNYDEIIRQATNAIAHTEQLELLWLLEHRAHAFSMKCKFGAAEQDAETMIKYAPTLPQGYLCFGKLLSMQGKQTRALKVYQEGLEKVPTNHLAYGQLLQAKKMVDEKNNQHFDLVSALPLEIKDEIVFLLSEEERSNLFDVSTTWSQWLENCQEAWKFIYNDHDYAGNIAVSNVLSKIAKHINHLTITTIVKEIWLKYLEHLENGHFTNLKSLELPDHTVSNVLCTNSVTSLMNGFWETRYTLTKVDLTFSDEGSPVTITDILFYLPYLEAFKFDVRDILADVLGKLETLKEPHRSLVDLTLSAYPMSGDALKPLTKWCPYVRRLTLVGATPSVFDIVTNYFPNVEMLGYNNTYELPPSHEVLNQDYNNKEPIISNIGMNNSCIKQEQGRLRAFYFNRSARGVSEARFLRLLQKNQKTLEILHVNMSMTNPQDLDDVSHDNYRLGYPIKAASVVLNLDRLNKIIFWSDIYGVYEPLFCRMVAPSLNYFKSVMTSDLSAVVDTLINSRQQLETLGFAQVPPMHNDPGHTLATQCWIRLFNEYAATSLSEPNTTKKLRNVMFDYCCYISDDVLDALANIKTIKSLGFQGNGGITCQGLKGFFIKLNKQNVQISKLKLGEMTDEMDCKTLLDIISTMEELEALHLNGLHGLTTDDIKALIHSAKKLNTLVVKGCDRVDCEDLIAFVNNTSRKFKYVKITKYDDNNMLYFEFDMDVDFDTFN